MYVFSALGFYTVCPGTDQYVIGSPIFKSATLNLENGKKVIIKSNNTSSDNRYIASMKLNGKVYTKNYLTHKDLLDGASIVFDMSSVPNKQRGISQSDAPYSFSDELKR